MRILHVIATLDRRGGGPANSIRSIVGSYRELGHEGEILTLDRPSSPYYSDIDCPVHALGPVSTTFGYTYRLIPWLKAERHRFDGVVVHGLWQYPGYAVRRAFLGHAPYMIFSHGMLDPYFKQLSRLKHFKKWLYWVPVEYWVLRDAKRVLFTSEPEAKLAEKSFWLHRWTSQVVSYGAIAPTGSPEHYRRIFFQRYPALLDKEGNSKPYLLFLGRLHPKKGCDLLLSAFAKVAYKAPNLELVFVGPSAPDLKTKLAEDAMKFGIKTRVHWIDMLDGDEKWGAFYGCEAFVLPSHQENFGIAVVEALACGKPVLISNKVNIWESVLQDGAAIVAEDDSAGTLNLLERWLSLNENQRLAMGQNAMQSFHKRYDMEKNVRSLIRLFSELTTETLTNDSQLPQRDAR